MNKTFETVVQTLIWVCVGYVVFVVMESVLKAFGVGSTANAGAGNGTSVFDNTSGAAADFQNQISDVDEESSNLNSLLDNLQSVPQTPGFTNVTDPVSGQVYPIAKNFYDPATGQAVDSWSASLGLNE